MRVEAFSLGSDWRAAATAAKRAEKLRTLFGEEAGCIERKGRSTRKEAE